MQEKEDQISEKDMEYIQGLFSDMPTWEELYKMEINNRMVDGYIQEKNHSMIHGDIVINELTSLQV